MLIDGGAAASCGPLDVRVDAGDERLASVAQAYFNQYSGIWPRAQRAVEIELVRAVAHLSVNGDFLHCARMRVDRYPSTFAALTEHGISSQGMCGSYGDRWTVCAPPELALDESLIAELHDLLSLICSVGWHAEGWCALDAAAIQKGNASALVCASSGEDKRAFTTAMASNGWLTLGDDKLLLRAQARWVVARNLLRVRASIAERYALEESAPTHLFCLERTSGITGLRATGIAREDILPVLLRHIVIPSDPEYAQSILRAIAACAHQLLAGIRIEIGDGDYSDPDWTAPIRELLR